MAEEDECSGFPHSNACVVWAMRTGETLCPEPRSISSPTVVEGGRVVIEPIANLLRAGQIVGLDPREMTVVALEELERDG